MDNTFTLSELIELFLDGEATADERTQLFSALTQNSELRAEFDEALQLRCALAADVQRWTPRPALETMVFARISAMQHFARQIGETAALTFAASGTSTTSWMSIRNVVGAVCIALITGAAVFFLTNYPPSLPTVSEGGAIRSTADATTDAVHTARRTAQRREVRIASTTSKSMPPHRVHELSKVLASKSEQGSAFPVEIVSPPEITFGEEFHHILPTSPDALLQNVRSPEIENHLLKLEATPETTFRISVCVRGDITHELTRNASILIAYDLNDAHAIGIEVGREVIAAISSLDREGHVEHPSLFWAGPTFRWTPKSFQVVSAATPYAEATTAVTGWGPLLRGALGFMWNPIEPVRLLLGVNCLGFAYRDQQHWNTTGKLSMSFGVGVHL